MGRFWLGAGLLAALLALGLWTSGAMVRLHEDLAVDLDRAAQAAQSGDWQEARARALSAGGQWERQRRKAAALADHTPMEDIDALFAQAEVFGRQEETADFAAACAELSMRLRAMGDAHTPQWWNLL